MKISSPLAYPEHKMGQNRLHPWLVPFTAGWALFFTLMTHKLTYLNWRLSWNFQEIHQKFRKCIQSRQCPFKMTDNMGLHIKIISFFQMSHIHMYYCLIQNSWLVHQQCSVMARHISLVKRWMITYLSIRNFPSMSLSNDRRINTGGWG